jgi:hypothetical protein
MKSISTLHLLNKLTVSKTVINPAIISHVQKINYSTGNKHILQNINMDAYLKKYSENQEKVKLHLFMHEVRVRLTIRSCNRLHKGCKAICCFRKQQKSKNKRIRSFFAYNRGLFILFGRFGN